MRHPLAFTQLAFAMIQACLWSCAAAGADGAAKANGVDGVDYVSQIKPLLAEKCYSCHGAIKQEAGLRLETRALMVDGDVISPGAPGESELLNRIQSNDDDRMPPPEEGAALMPDQIRRLERWIRDGAIAPKETPPPSPTEHWAFQPLPELEGDLRSPNPVDELLESKWKSAGIHPVESSARSLLLRRLYLDLVGLPPTPEQLEDERPWNEIVDSLLSDPAYGERWARHWMDVWRYSDWYGLGAQVRYSQKHIWRWRDWIVRSLNDDKGYDRMILEMIAGDELAPEDPQVVAGTGFLARNYYLFNRTTWLDSTIEHTGKAFLGLTLNCAKCHDHKYDPITQLDYYRFRALLEPHQIRLDAVPGVTDFEQDALPRAFDDSVDRPTYLHVRGDPKNPDKSRKIDPGVPAILSGFALPITPVALPATAFAPGTRKHVQQSAIAKAQRAVDQAKGELADAEKKLDEFLAAGPQTESTQVADFEITDSFDSPNESIWQLVGEGWEYKDGALLQTKPTREGIYAKLIADLPRDFQVECDYTTTGGTTYKSVSFRFDQSDDRKTENFVYTSAHAPGPKVHVAFTRNGASTYPPEGRKARPIKVNQKYRLRFAVRDTLVNVWIDDEFMVAYRLPDRHKGFFSISGFDATVAFDHITIKSLDPNFELTAAGNKPVATTADAKTAVEASRLKLAAANSGLDSVKATIDADVAKFGNNVSTDEATRLARVALRKQLEAEIADAEYRILSEATDAGKLKTAKDQKQAATKRLDSLDDSDTKDAPEYASLRGSRKALESPAHKEADYPASYASVSTGRRLALAKWMTAKENPLTARVAVNHVWLRHFGTPLVESVFDFGLRAKKPLHADLLDRLAAELVASGWSFKHLHARIVKSKAYQRSSSSRNADAKTLAVDPGNTFYWRANSKRMESQLVRDSLISLGDQLDKAMGGPSIEPSPAVRRRSLYLKHSRDQQDLFLTMFDDADILQCYRRSESIVPQQALALSNSKLAIEMSSQISERISAVGTEDSSREFARRAFELILCRAPTKDELAECETFSRDMKQLPEIQAMNSAEVDTRIRHRLIQALLNHNDFVTIR